MIWGSVSRVLCDRRMPIKLKFKVLQEYNKNSQCYIVLNIEPLRKNMFLKLSVADMRMLTWTKWKIQLKRSYNIKKFN